MQALRKGDAGPDVVALQKSLIAAGHGLMAGRKLTPDGRFGHDTDLALRQFQRERGLIPDGVAGPRTREALNTPARNGSFPFSYLADLIGDLATQVALRARSWPALLGFPASPVHFKTSAKGVAFIYKEEARPNVSNVLHWPGGDNSGVTLGPGYDMGGRTPSEISADLQAIDVSREVADKVAKAAGLKGQQARQFVKDNASLIKSPGLKGDEELALLRRVLPQYEAKVKEAVRIDLYQHEFDALVSFAYNVGSIPVTAGHLNRGEVDKAIKVIRSATTSKGVELPVLVKRRDREVTLYLYGEYGHLPRIA